MEMIQELSEKQRTAQTYFRSGYSCAQSVLMTFHEACGLSEQAAARVASSFGGGIGGMREVCGTVSAMALVLGYVAGYDAPDDLDAKKAHYAQVRALVGGFTDRHGTLVCRELLKKAGAQPKPDPSPRTEQYYKVRPCETYVLDAVALLEDWFKTR